jgi:hypothetical protein
MEDDEFILSNLNLPVDSLLSFKDYNAVELKLGHCSRVQFKRFDEENYNCEPMIKLENERGIEIEKKIYWSNYIRWRENESAPIEEEDKAVAERLGYSFVNNKFIESNAQLVEWSDGSYQLLIGDQYFDIISTDLKQTKYGVKVSDNVLLKGQVNKKFIAKPTERAENSMNSKIISETISKNKTKLAYSFFDRNEYRKQDFSGRSGKYIGKMPKHEILLEKKRKRSFS